MREKAVTGEGAVRVSRWVWRRRRRAAGSRVGFGNAELAEVEVAVVEGEGEVDGVGGALGGGEPGAEGVEGALEEEEEGFEGVERVVELLLGVIVRGRAVESEEAVVLAVQDVVQAGGVGTEAFGEALAGEGGKFAEGGDAPELEQIGDLRWAMEALWLATSGWRLRIDDL